MRLKGTVIAVSIGGSPDLGKLGYPEREVQRALLSVCGAFVRAGAQIAYAGDFRADGFTVQMYRYLASSYADQGAKPFHHYLPEPVLRRTAFADLVASLQECQAVAVTTAFLGDHGVRIRASDNGLLWDTDADRIPIRSSVEYDAWLLRFSPSTPESGLRLARAAQTDGSQARIAMGGKMGLIANSEDTYEGSMPGVAEEALLTLRAGKPFIPFAAYGGAARDIAIALGLLDLNARTPRGEQASTYGPAIKAVGDLASKIPPECISELRTVATLDRIETIADLAVSIVDRWQHATVKP